MASAEPNLSGQRIDAYVLHELVASGGSSDVYVGAEAATGHRVAVKVLRCMDEGGEAWRRFEREQRLLAELRHEGIVGWRAAGVLEGRRPYLVTDFVAGDHLDAWAHGRPLAEVLNVFAAVCTAVGAAHRRGVVHRDLKPTNVLVNRAGRPTVLDFGVARDRRRCDDTITVGMVPLTPFYASPESLGDGAQGPSSDVFSLGVMLRDLVTAAGGGTTRQLRDCTRIVDRCTNLDPAGRYPHANALRADVARVARGRPLGLASLVSARVRRHRRLLASSTVAAASLTLAAIFTWNGSVAADKAHRDALDVSEFLVRLLDIASPGEHGPTITLPEAWRLAESRIPMTFVDNAHGEARVRMAYGRAYARAGDATSAIRHLERAIELLRGDPRTHPGSLHWCEQLLARCRRRRGG